MQNPNLKSARKRGETRAGKEKLELWREKVERENREKERDGGAVSAAIAASIENNWVEQRTAIRKGTRSTLAWKGQR